MARIETHAIAWRCAVCTTRGTVPQLHDATVTAIRDKVERTHEQKSPGCHMIRGISAIVAKQHEQPFDLTSANSLEKIPPAPSTVDEQADATGTLTLGAVMETRTDQQSGINKTPSSTNAGGTTRAPIGDAEVSNTRYGGAGVNADSPSIDDEYKQLFGYKHLGDDQQPVARWFADVAQNVLNMPPSAQRTFCLQSLLIAKDAGVRASFLTV